MLERVDGLVSVETRKARLALGLGLGINRRERQEVVLVAETPNSPDIKKGPLWGYLHSEERERHTEKINIRKTVKKESSSLAVMLDWIWVCGQHRTRDPPAAVRVPLTGTLKVSHREHGFFYHHRTTGAAE